MICRSTSNVRIHSVTEILVLGASRAGKTLLLRRIGELPEPKSPNRMATIPTVGVELVTIVGEGTHIILREVGAALSSRWSMYFTKASALLYIIDGFDETVADDARELLLGVLQNEHIQSIPIGLVFTKSDLDPDGINRQVIQSIVQLDQLTELVLHDVKLFEGTNIDHALAQSVLTWVKELGQ